MKDRASCGSPTERSEEATTYRHAVAAHFPLLPLESFELLGEGWGSAAYLADRSVVFRFPKNEEAARKLAVETALLPELQPTLAVAVPRFEYVAPASPVHSFPFAGYPLISGERLDRCTDAVREAEWWRRQMGAFLTAMHRFPVQRAVDLGVGGSVSAERLRAGLRERHGERLEAVAALLSPRQTAAIADYLDDALGDDRLFAFAPVLLHGDAGANNVLVDPAEERVTGVIDFAECTIGDPALDVGRTLLPYYGGPVDAGWAARAEFYRRTAPLVDAEFFGRAGTEGTAPGGAAAADARVARALRKINRLWPP